MYVCTCIYVRFPAKTFTNVGMVQRVIKNRVRAPTHHIETFHLQSATSVNPLMLTGVHRTQLCVKNCNDVIFQVLNDSMYVCMYACCHTHRYKQVFHSTAESLGHTDRLH